MPRSRSWLVEWRISHHPHRHHLYVGAPTVKAIWAALGIAAAGIAAMAVWRGRNGQ